MALVTYPGRNPSPHKLWGSLGDSPKLGSLLSPGPRAGGLSIARSIKRWSLHRGPGCALWAEGGWQPESQNRQVWCLKMVLSKGSIFPFCLHFACVASEVAAPSTYPHPSPLMQFPSPNSPGIGANVLERPELSRSTVKRII